MKTTKCQECGAKSDLAVYNAPGSLKDCILCGKCAILWKTMFHPSVRTELGEPSEPVKIEKKIEKKPNSGRAAMLKSLLGK